MVHERLMTLVGAGLLILLALASYIVAWKPTLPVLRSVYWWRLFDKSPPSLPERLGMLIPGTLLLMVGGVSLYLALVDRH
jgi:hypothetical protein